jgi:replicative DNA helicase
MRSIAKNIRKSFKLIENLYVGSFDGLKVLTGYPEIDEQISGLHCGDLVTVIGDSGSGKTSFLANAALNIADQSKQKVLFYSLQYPAVQLALKMLFIKGKRSAYEMIRGYITIEDWHKMVNTAWTLSNLHLLIEDGAVEDVDCMLKKIRRRQQKIPDLKLIIIDSIDMLAVSGTAHYSECLRKIKAAAVDMRIPFLISAFMQKEHTKTKRKTTLFEDRIQAIETYSDTIMHIRMDSGNISARYNDIYRKRKGNINRQKLLPCMPEIYMPVRTEIAIIKNTYGPKGSVFLTFIPHQFIYESDEGFTKQD